MLKMIVSQSMWLIFGHLMLDPNKILPFKQRIHKTKEGTTMWP